MTKGKDQHVVPRKSGWGVHGEGNKCVFRGIVNADSSRR